jgi:hypothetical protein
MQATMEEKQHSTLYQVETDIALRKLSCPCGKHFVVHVTKSPLCPSCKKEMELPVVLTQEQMSLFLDETNVYLPLLRHSEEDEEEFEERVKQYRSDPNAEIDDKNALEESLKQFDWWFGDRIQIQFIWDELRFHPSRKYVSEYLESAYKMAYHRDDYC